jgi:hypothetical protein
MLSNGECSGFNALDVEHLDDLSSHPVAHIGVTVDIRNGAVLPVMDERGVKGGFVDILAHSLEYSGDTFVCTEIAPYDAHGPTIASRAIQLISSTNQTFSRATTIALVPYFQEYDKLHRMEDPNKNDCEGYWANFVYQHQLDPYGYCLGRLSECTGKWECEDENLEWAYGYLQGKTWRHGIYAIIRDNCPDAVNPQQEDKNLDGIGDACGDGCKECGTMNGINKKYVRSSINHIHEDAYYGMKPFHFYPGQSCLPNFMSKTVPPSHLNEYYLNDM